MVAEDPSDLYITVYGQAVLDRGLVVSDAINGAGLLTFGLIWQCPQIWLDIQQANPITTGWTGVPGSTALTTGWTGVPGSTALATSWTNYSFGTEC